MAQGGGRGLDLRELASLPVYLYWAGGKDARPCAVCLSPFKRGDQVRMLPGCNHMFHEDCIDPWLLLNATCPLCRNPLTVSLRPSTPPPEPSSPTPPPESPQSSPPTQPSGWRERAVVFSPGRESLGLQLLHA